MFVNMLGRGIKYEKQNVLNDISFDIQKGEFFGIVGRNGSGKSTLLKLLAGVYSPDSGSISVNGRLTPFIELGVGFNHELTGRDNVYLNGALLGFSKSEMDDIYDDIVSFAELEKFMDQKLKNYSSGMQVRLAFSIAIKAKNDILIFDEVLAVGDEAFQQKCLRIFEEYKENFQTVVLVTHDMESVKNLCTRAMLIDKEGIKYIGDVEQAAKLYSDINIKAEKDPIQETNKHKKSKKSSLIQIKSKNNKRIYKPSEELVLELWLQKPISKNTYIGVAIIDSDGRYVFGSNTKGLDLKGTKIKHSITLDLGPGKYTINTAILGAGGKPLDLNEKALSFKIIDDANPNVGGGHRLKYVYKQGSV